MSEMYKVCGAAIAALIAVIILRQSGSSYGELVPMFFGICIIIRVIDGMSGIVEYLRRLAEGSTAEKHLHTLMKAGAISLASEFTADLCRDAGVGNVASYVELFGKCELIILSLPLITELLELSFSLLRL